MQEVTRLRDKEVRSQDCSIKPKDNGPLLVTGPVKLVDAEGNEFQVDMRKGNIALCRCGASHDKPFCDGSHKQIGFQAVDRATTQKRKSA
ncbi:MAG: CDGSH iron-sulfur domain-containing protein [Actinomycetota bacterium]|nr:CDGSH iron-sulfur domain-containing protein [Actinomycetota bacterium]